MKIAIASGKGGTGKTTVATCLARVWSETGARVRYLDCDVEEPNGHLFLHPELGEPEPVTVPTPEVDREKCVGCGACARICQYAAIACVRRKVLTFPELCHGCGGCARVCPAEAIRETGREVGSRAVGLAGGLEFAHGCLRVGQAQSAPLIRSVRSLPTAAEFDLIDAPPGTACPVVAALRGVDFVLLVTEPTPFGLHDLGLALELVRELGLPHAVAVNRHEPCNDRAREFCRERGVPLAVEIPDDRRVAEAYSRGELPVAALPEYRELFLALRDGILKLAGDAEKRGSS